MITNKECTSETAVNESTSTRLLITSYTFCTVAYGTNYEVNRQRFQSVSPPEC